MSGYVLPPWDLYLDSELRLYMLCPDFQGGPPEGHCVEQYDDKDYALSELKRLTLLFKRTEAKRYGMGAFIANLAILDARRKRAAASK